MYPLSHLWPRRRRAVLVLTGLILLSLCTISAGPLPPLAPTPEPQPTASVGTVQRPLPAPTTPGPTIDAYHLITPDQGWLLLNNHLYQTQTGGQTWNDITPPDLAGYEMRAVTFFDTQSGWLVLTKTPAESQMDYALARTTDGGRTWQLRALPLFAPNEVQALASALYLQFLDAQTGWLVVRQATSSNFSLGTLFRTNDGGNTWTRLTLPLGEPVRFVTADVGWTAGGAAGNQLYRTLDGGLTWSPQTPASLSSPEPHYLLPDFTDSQTGIFPVVTTPGGHPQVEFHVTRDGGLSWQKAAQVPVGQTATSAIAVAVIDGGHWAVVDPGNQELTRLSSGAATGIRPTFPTTAHLTSLDMVSPEVGWALSTVNDCSREPDITAGATIQTTGQCVRVTQLLRTGNGGQDWIALLLPPAGVTALSTASAFVTRSEPNASASISGGPSLQAIGGNTQILSGQGFDICTIPSLAALQDWFTNSPYRAVNLYIGGSLRACANTALTAAYLTQLSHQGWAFIPTWVGPQVACSGFSSSISDDPTTAYNQGVSEADLATEAAANLGLTLADKSGTILYYDLEAYLVADPACTASRQAAKSFVSGWTSRLHARGNQAGVYGGAYGSALADFAGIANVPDAIWLAAWRTPAQYRSDVTVWLGANSYLDDNLWSNHQRLRQYAGGHDELWGATTLNIDSDVISGIVTYVYAPTVSTQIYLTYPNSPFRDFQVLVNGSGPRSPIAGYSLQSQMDGGPWLDVGTIITSATRVTYNILSPDDNQHAFSFRARAWDSAGYQSQYPPVGDSSHTVPAQCQITPASGDIAEPDNTYAQAKPLGIGAASLQDHNFHALADVDWVTLTVQAGTTYIIATGNTGGFADTVITLYQPDHVTFIAENDDAPGNWPASRLVWKPAVSGTYYLKVRHFDIYGYGCSTAYTLAAVQARQTFLPVIRRP